ncbi:hypothetical protein PSTG_00023 [Puccinia striiformis f. sp. tritici PST-78]|uniref:Uncharacterized protein n=1 Tax=Puccinia striiformis f. sp. tritici PST-78 TaxID=1165861 RepID=A0A0L0W5F1_9BASI|nr:hypothetical protein PSTG_00023 [Puccinia striiformis f. sp. tritici PST-78]
MSNKLVCDDLHEGCTEDSRAAKFCLSNSISDQSHKRKITGRSSIDSPDSKRVACERESNVNDVAAVIHDDQRSSISKIDLNK